MKQKITHFTNYLKYYFSLLYNLVTPSNKRIWLIGENLGNHASDNGFYFFKYMIENNPEEVYFIYNKHLPELTPYRKSLIKRNSFKHFYLYFKSQYNILSHGARDTIPDYIFYKKKHNIKSIIYLQHGIIKFKSIYFNCESYNKSILKFIVSSEEEKEIVSTKMMPKKVKHELMFTRWKLDAYQNYQSTNLDTETIKYINETVNLKSLEKKLKTLQQKIGLHPSRVLVSGLSRHDTLLEQAKKITKDKNNILIFPTWRDELSKTNESDFEASNFYKCYADLLKDKNLHKILEKYNFKIKFVLHNEMAKYQKSFTKLSTKHIIISENNNIRDLILTSKYLITDYSSLSWEFNLLKKPVLFYHFDYEEYFTTRSNYVNDISDWFGYRIQTSKEVISTLTELIQNNISTLNYNEQITYRDQNNNQRIYQEILKIPQKIYFLVYNIYGVGGTVKTTINTANYLYANGYDIEIISIKQTSAIPKLNLHPGIKVRSLLDARKNTKRYKNNSINAIIKNFIRKTLLNIPSLLIHKDEDLYKMFSFFTDIQILKTLIPLRNSTIITTIPSFNFLAIRYCHQSMKIIGQEHKSFNVHSLNIQNLIKKLYNKLNYLTVLTKDDYKRYKELNILKENKIKIQPNATNIPPEIPKNLITRPKRIISLARFVPDKRLDLLIESFNIVHKKHPEWILDIFGAGPEKDKLIAQIKDLNLSKVISIYPSTSNVEMELSNSSIFALTSQNEGFGMTIIEANSQGVPVVAFNIPNGPRELIQDKKTGLLAKPFDIYDFADKISFLIENPHIREEFGQEAYLFVKENYSINHIGKKFETLLS